MLDTENCTLIIPIFFSCFVFCLQDNKLNFVGLRHCLTNLLHYVAIASYKNYLPGAMPMWGLVKKLFEWCRHQIVMESTIGGTLVVILYLLGCLAIAIVAYAFWSLWFWFLCLFDLNYEGLAALLLIVLCSHLIYPINYLSKLFSRKFIRLRFKCGNTGLTEIDAGGTTIWRHPKYYSGKFRLKGWVSHDVAITISRIMAKGMSKHIEEKEEQEMREILIEDEDLLSDDTEKPSPDDVETTRWPLIDASEFVEIIGRNENDNEVQDIIYKYTLYKTKTVIDKETGLCVSNIVHEYDTPKRGRDSFTQHFFPGSHYESLFKNIQIKADVTGRITSIWLLPPPMLQRARIIENLTFDSTRADVFRTLGKPLRTSEDGEWDRYDSTKYSMHFTYLNGGKGIEMVTLMHPDSAP